MNYIYKIFLHSLIVGIFFGVGRLSAQATVPEWQSQYAIGKVIDLIAVFALLIRKELLLPILCGIFFIESLSVIMQVTYFKYTKKRYGEGRRIFLMSPLHHHFQKKGYFESKIVVRFWIVQLLLAAITLVTLKIR